MPLKIVNVGDPVLRAPARPLTREEVLSARIKRLIQQMRETMRQAPGVGLAAPQVGESLQLVVIEDRPEMLRDLAPDQLKAMGRGPVPFEVLINPVVVCGSGPADVFFEGCLSVPGYRALVPRASQVEVVALNHRAEEVRRKVHHWHARIVQHEVDHLQGVLCVDRMLTRSLVSTESYKEVWCNRAIDEVMAAFAVERL